MNKKLRLILVSSILLWIFGVIFMMLTCGGFFNWVYQLPPNIWLTPEQITSANNMIASNILSFARSVIFASVYGWLYKGLPGKGIRKGLNFGFIVFVLGAFSAIITMPFYMTINNVVVIYWILQALVSNLINGAIVGAIYKER